MTDPSDPPPVTDVPSPVPADAPHPPQALDAEGRVAVEAPCVGCGYLLRGLWPHDACPECGEAIEPSLRADLLRFGDPDRLRRLRRGAGVLIAALVLGIASLAAAIVQMPFAPLFLGLAMAGVLVGSLMVSAPVYRQRERWRLAGWLAALAGPAAWALDWIAENVPLAGFAFWMGWLINITVFIAPLVVVLALASVARARGRGLHDQRLIRHTAWMRRSCWASAILIALMLGFSALGTPSGRSTIPRPTRVQPLPQYFSEVSPDAAHNERLADGTIITVYPPGHAENPHPSSRTVIERQAGGLTVETVRTEYPDGSHTLYQSHDDGWLFTSVNEEYDAAGQRVGLTQSMRQSTGWRFQVMLVLWVGVVLAVCGALVWSMLVLTRLMRSVERMRRGVLSLRAAQPAGLPAPTV